MFLQSHWLQLNLESRAVLKSHRTVHVPVVCYVTFPISLFPRCDINANKSSPVTKVNYQPQGRWDKLATVRDSKTDVSSVNPFVRVNRRPVTSLFVSANRERLSLRTESLICFQRLIPRKRLQASWRSTAIGGNKATEKAWLAKSCFMISPIYLMDLVVIIDISCLTFPLTQHAVNPYTW